MWPFTSPFSRSVRSAFGTYMNHMDSTSTLESTVAHISVDLVIGSGLDFSSLPDLPDRAWLLFRLYLEIALRREYDLTTEKTANKAKALEIFCNLRDLGIKLEHLHKITRAEGDLMMGLLNGTCLFSQLWLFTGIGDVDEEAAMAAVTKWENVHEREEDLRRLQDESEAPLRYAQEILRADPIVVGRGYGCETSVRKRK